MRTRRPRNDVVPAKRALSRDPYRVMRVLKKEQSNYQRVPQLMLVVMGARFRGGDSEINPYSPASG